MRNPIILALATVVLCACGDAATAPTSTPIATNPLTRSKTRDTLIGIVHQVPANIDAAPEYTLTTADGNSFYLVGPNATAAASLDGIKALVSGKLDAATFWVESVSAVLDTPDPCTEPRGVGDPVPDKCVGGATQVRPRKP